MEKQVLDSLDRVKMFWLAQYLKTRDRKVFKRYLLAMFTCVDYAMGKGLEY